MTNGFSNVAITAGVPVRNFEQRAPARQLKLGSAKIEPERELAALAREVFLEFTQIRRKGRLGLMQLSRAGIHLQHAIFEFESHQALRGRGQEEAADRRNRAHVEQRFHDEERIADSTLWDYRCVCRLTVEHGQTAKASHFHGRLPGGRYCYFCCG